MSIDPRNSRALSLIPVAVMTLLIAGGCAAFPLPHESVTPTPVWDEPPAAGESSGEIVLRASVFDGTELAHDKLDITKDIIVARLSTIGVSASSLFLTGDQIHVTFDRSVDAQTFERAVDLLDVAFSSDFRPVLAVGVCDPSETHTDPDPGQPASLCDQDGVDEFDLGPAELSANTLEDAFAFEVQNAAGGTGDWGVTLEFDQEGTAAFAALTQRLFEAGFGHNQLAIVLDGKVLSAPTVNAEITDGKVSISGLLDEAEARALAQQLKLAAIGLALQVESTSTFE